MRRVITLTTDFGLADPYVAAVKGVILSLNPEAILVDVSHDVRAQQVEQGAFLLGAAWPYFPRGSIHIAVVDPGVGTERRAIVVQAEDTAFVGPDNGVLSAALPDSARAAAAGGATRVPLPTGVRAFELTEAGFHRPSVSATFHGRDIFAPVAAHLSLGVPPSEMGPQVEEIVALPPFRAAPQPDGSLRGRVLHMDRFGNMVTDVRAEQVAARRVVVEVGGCRTRGLNSTYAGSTGLCAIIGSTGFLEIALPGGSAAAALRADIGAPVSVRFE